MNDENGLKESSPYQFLYSFLEVLHQFQNRCEPVLRLLDWSFVKNVFLVIMVAFVVASSAATLMANWALNAVIKEHKSMANVDISTLMEHSTFRRPDAITLSPLKKRILDRNIFNSEGTLAPDADDAKGSVTKSKDLNFALFPCTNQPLPVQVVGTIYNGDPQSSVVSIKDPKVPDTDTYRAGDVIIDHDEYEVYAVRHGTVEFRKGDQKICTTIVDDPRKPKALGVAPTSSQAKAAEVITVELDQTYVADQIGPGYANILNSHKLIPEVQNGKPIGFKMIAINPGSLLDKAKFQNGDVLTDVNSVSLSDPSQGFKLYQALQEEREVSVKLLRNGEAQVIKVLIK